MSKQTFARYAAKGESEPNFRISWRAENDRSWLDVTECATQLQLQSRVAFGTSVRHILWKRSRVVGEKKVLLRVLGFTCAVFALAGCPGIPPVNTATISQNPANAQRYAAARQAVNICSRLPNTEAVMRGFEELGYQRSRLEMTTTDGKKLISESINSQNSDLKVIASSAGCTIGLEGMTPDQSFQLIKPWVRKFGLVTNEALGQGLSPHVVQAWQFPTFPHSQILASAGKTWHSGSGLSSNVPGASVRLIYRQR